MTHPPRRLAVSLRVGRRWIAALGAAILAGGQVAAGPSAAAVDRPATVIAQSPASMVTGGDVGSVKADRTVATTASTASTASGAGAPELRPTIHYEESLAHEDDRIAFIPGDRVAVGFRPRAGDTWPVGGHAPRALPAGSASGREMAASPQGSRWATDDSTTSAGSGSPTEPPSSAAPQPPIDVPAVDASAVPADVLSASLPDAAVAAAPSGTGMLRQVFGFLPYWELSDSSTTLNYDVLSTIGYFSVGADSNGNILKRNADGSTTTGWGGWTSSRLTSVISAAHQKHTRVVLTITVFAWTSSQATKQAALLGNPTARLNLARQAAAAVRDRGADGINLDFEPIVSGYADEFTAFVRTVRAELDRIAPGYQLTFDTTGYIGNYPIESATASGAADAIFVMGYDYRTSGANPVGSTAPLTAPVYDITDTVRAYLARVPASKVILGVPYYGRAWSTDSDLVHARNISGTKYGSSTTVVYTTAVDFATTYGRRWDAVEQSPWVAYRRQNCTATYGCVTSWRQIYYDDSTSLRAKYDLVNRYALRGTGIWALGYDGTRTELNRALADKFLRDTTGPFVGVKTLGWRQRDAGFTVAWIGDDISGIASYDVQVSVDGGAFAAWRTATTATSDVYLGTSGHGYAFRARGKDTKGNVGPWDVTSTWKATPTLAVGGFGGVRADGLSMRTAPDTSAAKVGELSLGQIVSVVGGPASGDGYTWWQVSGPLREWRPVSPIDASLWVAAGTASDPWLVASRAPNSTIVDAVIRDLTVGQPSGTALAGSPGSRSFSPNGDGQRDSLRLAWTNSIALDSLSLKVYRADGSLVGSIGLPDTGPGTQTYDWNGIVGGGRVADGTYLLALSGIAAGTVYSAPSSQPITSAQLAAYGVTVDTVAPVVSASSLSRAAFSPNGDGTADTVTASLSAPALASWGFAAAPLWTSGAGSPVRTASGAGSAPSYAWDGRTNGGATVADGKYRLTIWGADAAGNRASRAWDVGVDTRRVAITSSAIPRAFSPNGDRVAETSVLAWSADEAASGTARIVRGSTTYRIWAAGRSGSLAWDGRDRNSTLLADGSYTFRVDLVDGAGNRTVRDVTVVIDRTAGHLAWTPALFFPQDGDAVASSSKVSFRLGRTAVTTLRVYDAGGGYVKTAWVARSLAAGTWSWTWNGRDGTGALVARGWYRAVLTATSWVGTTTLTRLVLADAFSVTMSPLSPTGGQALTVNLWSAEPLKAAPAVTFTQAGKPAVTRTATSLGGNRYRVAFFVVSGAPGKASLWITARDAAGHAVSQLSSVTVR